MSEPQKILRPKRYRHECGYNCHEQYDAVVAKLEDECDRLRENMSIASNSLAARVRELEEALRNLVRTFEDGSHYETQNPYTRPQVKAALAALARK